MGSSAGGAAMGTAENTLMLCDKAGQAAQECVLSPRERGWM